jgi:hypothetical protein
MSGAWNFRDTQVDETLVLDAGPLWAYLQSTLDFQSISCSLAHWSSLALGTNTSGSRMIVL